VHADKESAHVSEQIEPRLDVALVPRAAGIELEGLPVEKALH